MSAEPADLVFQLLREMRTEVNGNVGFAPVSQHFLLSEAARSLSLAHVARLSDEEAHDAFRLICWTETKGEAVSPPCSCAATYAYKARRLWKCKACSHLFSVTSDTIFASRERSISDILLAIAIFANGAKGHSALQLSRDLDCQYKMAFVLAHKIREAITADCDERTLAGEVEVDGAYFGGYVKPANEKENRVDRRKAQHQTGERKVVVVMHEPNGETLPFVFGSESAAVSKIAMKVMAGSSIFADEAASWDRLHDQFMTKRISHQEAYSTAEACTNGVGSFSRLRGAEIDIHHHIAGPYLEAYGEEMVWREDRRRVSNGEQYLAVTEAALRHPVNRVRKGYRQRAAA